MGEFWIPGMNLSIIILTYHDWLWKIAFFVIFYDIVF